jgi:hypothetical protein
MGIEGGRLGVWDAIRQFQLYSLGGLTQVQAQALSSDRAEALNRHDFHPSWRRLSARAAPQRGIGVDRQFPAIMLTNETHRPDLVTGTRMHECYAHCEAALAGRTHSL